MPGFITQLSTPRRFRFLYIDVLTDATVLTPTCQDAPTCGPCDVAPCDPVANALVQTLGGFKLCFRYLELGPCDSVVGSGCFEAEGYLVPPGCGAVSQLIQFAAGVIGGAAGTSAVLISPDPSTALFTGKPGGEDEPI